MKKITLLLSFLFLGYGGFSQSLSSSGNPPTMFGDENTLLDASVLISNISSNSIDVLVHRYMNNLAPGHKSYFCWGITCYGDTTDWATDWVTIAVSGSSNSFHGYLNPHGNFGQSQVCYSFYDMNNPPDSISICLDYDISVGFQDPGAPAYNPLSDASPNPANNLTSINYNSINSNSRIVIYNLIGIAVKEVKLNTKQGPLVLVTSDLKPGVYYYSLIAGDKTLATKKLVITHK